MSFLDSAFRHVVRQGSLKIIDADGRCQEYGGGEPSVTIRLHDRFLHRRILIRPSLAIGEAYMDGRMTIEDGTIFDFLDLLSRNVAASGDHPIHAFFDRIAMLFRRFQQYNPIGKAQRNAAHHYDLSGQLYELFLDRDRQYSCAYFAHDGDTLDTAQDNKKRHIAAKLLLRPGQKILDIGSGWGGLGLYLASFADADVTGVTLSEEQHKVSNQRARDQNLGDRARFHLRDYREQSGRFDRIVSVGMFEHIGIGHYGEYFAKMSELLTDDGVALLHTIGDSGVPSATDPWIRKYIFPGGYIPSLSEVMPAIEKAGLIVTDIEFLGRHYAETLKFWAERFQASRAKVAEIYDQRFCRMWEYYLAGSEASFRNLGMTVFQIQITKQPGIVPITRDYIGDWERAHSGEQRLRDQAA